jgi:putative nucleotidyltransferase with HDIG domain
MEDFQNQDIGELRLVDKMLARIRVKPELQNPQYLRIGYRRRILQTLVIASTFFLAVLTVYNGYQYFIDPTGLWNVRNLISDGLALLILSITWWVSRRGVTWLANCLYFIFLYAAILESYSLQNANLVFLVMVLPVSLSSFTVRPWASLPMALVSIGIYTWTYYANIGVFDYQIFSVGLLLIMAAGAGMVSHVLNSTIQNMALAYDETIRGWAKALEMRDTETLGHSQRVTRLTLQLAKKMGIQEPDLNHLRRGVMLHDIGKMAIPDAILHKPGDLTPEEWAIMRKHTEYARHYLAGVRFLAPALDIPYSHHEKWDGTGYPQKLKGQQIPLFARIFAIVDVWDALTSDRPYSSSWSHEKALEYIIAESGKHFDPQIVPVFVELIQSQIAQEALNNN